MMNFKYVALVFALAFAPLAMAQDYPPPVNDQAFSAAPTRRSEQELKVKMEVGAPGSVEKLASVLVARKLAQVIPQIGESASQSIQNGANTTSTASTSLVTKSMSSILGIAQEAGAISSSTSGNATTLTANVPQLFNLLEPTSKRCYLISQTCSFGSELIRGATVSVSLNTSTKSSTPSLSNLSAAALTGLTGVQNPTFNSFSFQESLHGRKKTDIKQEDFEGALNKIGTDKKTDLINSFELILKPITEEQQGNATLTNEYITKLTKCVKSFEAPDALGEDRLRQLEGVCVDDFADVVQSIPGIDDLVTKFMQTEAAYNVARDAALTALFYDSTFSFEYDLTNNANQPMLSTFKGVYGYQHKFKRGMLQTTANGSATLYDSLEGSTQSRVRSAQGAVQFDYKPDTSLKVQPEFSAGYYFQYMIANGLITLPSTDFAPGTAIPLPSSASLLLNTTGPISIGQGKLTLSIKGTNFTIPLAVTGASRTDLVKANRVSGNFGISYDFSSFLTK